MRTAAAVLMVTLLLGNPGQAASPVAMYQAFTAALLRSGKVRGVPAKCIGFEDEEETPDHYDVRAHEVHGRGCAGDPETSPTLAFLRFMKKTRVVLIQNDDGDYAPVR